MRHLVLLALAACGEAPTVDAACFDLDPTVRIGAGSRDFERLADRAPLEVHLGPQGGYHVVYALRPSGVNPEVDATVEVVDRETGRVLTSTTEWIALDAGPDSCTLEQAGLLAVLDIDSAKEVAGHVVDLHITLTDEDRVAENAVAVRLKVAK